MSAYGNLASARTDIGRNLSDIAGIGIEMEYGSEGRIAGQMEQSRIQRQTEAIGLGLESIQQVAGLGKSAAEEAARAKEMGELSGYGSVQTKGETKLWDLFRGNADIDRAGGESWWGEVGERIGTGLGFMDREYEIGGRRYTSSQLEAGYPYAKLGKDWKEVSQLMGGGTEGTYKSLESGDTTTYSRDKSRGTITYDPETGAKQLFDPETGIDYMTVDPMTGKPYTSKSVATTTSSGLPFVSYGEALKDKVKYSDYLNKFHQGGFTSTDDWESLFQ